MAKWFYKQSKLIQVLFLLIPGLNWFTEICVRWSAFFKRKSIITLLFAILFSVGGLVFGWVDLIWILLFNHLLFAKA